MKLKISLNNQLKKGYFTQDKKHIYCFNIEAFSFVYKPKGFRFTY